MHPLDHATTALDLYKPVFLMSLFDLPSFFDQSKLHGKLRGATTDLSTNFRGLNNSIIPFIRPTWDLDLHPKVSR